MRVHKNGCPPFRMAGGVTARRYKELLRKRRCDMIEQCNFKTTNQKGARELLVIVAGKIIPMCRISWIGRSSFNAECVLEDNCVLYQAYKNSAISQLPNAGNTVVRCLVCDGRGAVPYGYYPDQPKDATGAGQTTQCRSCMGRGIVCQK